MSDNAERNKQIYYTRADGATFKAIANKYGVTVERVRQIYLKEARRAEAFKLKRLYGTFNTIENLQSFKRCITSNRARACNVNRDQTEADRDLLQKADNLIAVYSER